MQFALLLALAVAVVAASPTPAVRQLDGGARVVGEAARYTSGDQEYTSGDKGAGGPPTGQGPEDDGSHAPTNGAAGAPHAGGAPHEAPPQHTYENSAENPPQFALGEAKAVKAHHESTADNKGAYSKHKVEKMQGGKLVAPPPGTFAKNGEKLAEREVAAMEKQSLQTGKIVQHNIVPANKLKPKKKHAHEELGEGMSQQDTLLAGWHAPKIPSGAEIFEELIKDLPDPNKSQ